MGEISRAARHIPHQRANRESARTWRTSERGGFSNRARGSEDPLLLIHAFFETFLHKLNPRWILLALFPLLLAGCNLSLAGAMEASINKLYEEVHNFELVQQTPWEEGGVALVTFDGVNHRSMDVEGCQGIGYYRGGFPGYSVFSVTASCDDPVASVRGDNPEALVTAGYGSALLMPQEVSVAFGLVNEPDGAEVRVTWDDGEKETVAVANGSYLAPRAGIAEVEQVVLLDEAGAILATAEITR